MEVKRHSSGICVSLSKERRIVGSFVVGEEEERRGPEDCEREVKAPDGGWGWAVVFASFMISVITDGISYTFGLFFVEITKEFGGSKSAASFIGSLIFGMTFGSGPVASVFVNRFGCRAVTMSGSVVAALGFGISYWATSITFLYISVGFIGGLGLGLMYLPSIVIVAHYFDKKLGFATGIAVCGSGFGNFLLALILDPVIHKLGWRPAIAIVAGILLFCIFFGAMYRPVQKVPPKIISLPNPTVSRKLLSRGTNASSPSNQELDLRDGHKEEKVTITLPEEISNITSKPDQEDNIKSTKELASAFGDSELKDKIMEMAEQNNVSTGIGNAPEDSPRRCCRSYFSPGCCTTIKSMMDFSLFVNPIFLYFAFSNFLTNVGYNIPYIYLADLAKHHLALTENDLALGIIVGSIGIANTLSRVVLGYVSDKTCVNRLFVYSTSLSICGIVAAHGYSLAVLVICAAVFGATGGVYVGLTSVVLVDLLGVNKLSNAFGIVLLCQGIGSVLGPPIVGSLFDYTGSYLPGFWLTGIGITLSGSMLYFVPCVKRKLSRDTPAVEESLTLDTT